MLQGRIIKLDTGYCFESTSFHWEKPQTITHIWPLVHCRLSGMSWCQETDAIGKAAQCRDGRVSCYLGNGNYFNGEMPQGGSTPAIEVKIADVPRPIRVRSELRWHRDHWQKLTAKGWKAA